MAFSVRVEGIRFAAGHFATFAGQCEPLHGHSYEVAAEVTGSLSDDSWVTDFRDLRRFLRDICEELDHRFILQAQSRELTIDRSKTAWKVRTPAGQGYVFPLADVASLPIDNSTAERLAEYLAGRLQEKLRTGLAATLQSVAVEVWEGPGQRARYLLEAAGKQPSGSVKGAADSLAAMSTVDNNARVVRRLARVGRVRGRQSSRATKKISPDGRDYVEPNRTRS
jgi:6-pyruvoyltetrahydropterin/6-carboxytetrahydropterin synthase